VSTSYGDSAIDAVLFDLDDVLVPFHTSYAWQWAWRPQGPLLGVRRVRSAVRRSLKLWDRRRWAGVTGRLPATDLAALREHLAATLFEIAGHPLPAEETEAVVRRMLRPMGDVERYPDVLPALERLKRLDVRVGVATPLALESARWLVHRVGLPESIVIATGDAPGPAVPDRAAFVTAAERLGAPRTRTAFVGDLFWSDVRAAHRAGLAALLLDRHDAWPRVLSGRMSTLESLEATLAAGPAPAAEPPDEAE